jgi:Complex I intermediate-associated protein 30 (CIA30)
MKFIIGSAIVLNLLRPWNSTQLTWTAVDDRVRGGSSTSYLKPLDTSDNSAVFCGHLDTKTLGGAGFASQSTRPSSDDPLVWNLTSYDGIAVYLGDGDNKTYTLTLKDTMPEPKRPDGRERSSISWEATFLRQDAALDSRAVWLPWDQFKPTYRGREKKDAEPLKVDRLRRFGLMMRSFFEEQAGDFRLEVRCIAAIKCTTPADQSSEEL